jgi:hypothetical protein
MEYLSLGLWNVLPLLRSDVLEYIELHAAMDSTKKSLN